MPKSWFAWFAFDRAVKKKDERMDTKIKFYTDKQLKTWGYLLGEDLFNELPVGIENNNTCVSTMKNIVKKRLRNDTGTIVADLTNEQLVKFLGHVISRQGRLIDDTKKKPHTSDSEAPKATTELLAPTDIARMAKVSDNTVRQWMREGDMPCIRIGRRLYITREMLDGFLADSTVVVGVDV